MLNFNSSTLLKPHRSNSSTSVEPQDSRSSSLQNIWAEDYCSDDEAGFYKNHFEELVASPAPAALTERPFPRSIPLTYGEEPPTPRESRTHHRSLTALLPFRDRLSSTSPWQSPQRSPERSPTREHRDFEFMPTLTGDTDGLVKIADKTSGGLSGWFGGSSAPLAIGIPIDDDDEFQTVSFGSTQASRSSTEKEAAKLQKRPTLPNSEMSQKQARPVAPSTSKFSFFSSSKTPVIQPTQVNSQLDDEFLTMDIQKALFPSGVPSDQDPFSPSAFKNLLANAEGLLSKLQNAYKARTLSLHDLEAENSAQAEELEEAELRAKYLRMQLEDMAAKVVQQDEEMANVVDKLFVERRRREEEKEAREQSIALIKSHESSPSETRRSSEDLDFTGTSRRKWRRSDGTVQSEGCESDNESAESVFSRSMSPTSTIQSDFSTPEMGQAVFAKVVNVSTSNARKGLERPKPVQRKSTFQKILKGISTDETDAESAVAAGEDDSRCNNCQGGPESIAWDTVSLLKAENKGLKERIQSLDKAVESALDLVGGLELRT